MSFIDNIKEQAKKDLKTIILPETNDIRILKAAEIALNEKIANIILIGNSKEIHELAENNNINIKSAKIIEPASSERYDVYVKELFELRKEKGMTTEKAKDLLLDNVYFGIMMVKLGEADGLISGACHSTADTLRPALQILKTASNTKLVSTFFVIVVPNSTYGENGIFVFSDCGLNENPDSEALSEIAISSANSFKQLVKQEPKIAMLSYSTYGSAKSEATEKVRNATQLVQQKQSNLKITGEIQLDAAIVSSVAKNKAPESEIAGECNTLIFPDLNSGNIGYKLVQRLAQAEAYGPLCQGIAKPVNDLSRGYNVDDIVGSIAITAVQAQKI